jgi:hypothetical protein
MKNFSNNSLKIFSFIAFIIFIYSIYRAEIHYMGMDRDMVYAKYLKYIVLSLFFLFLFLFLLKLNDTLKNNIVLSFYSLIIGLYLIEFIFLFNFNYLHNDSKKEILHNVNKIDSNFKLNKIKEFIKKDIYTFNTFSDEVTLDNNKKIYPLGSLANSNMFLCNESGKDIFYKSDRYGFRNPNYIWDSKDIEYLLIGDSYVHGACVDDNDTISGIIANRSKKDTINLGSGGSGPLKEYATFVEYGLQKKPKKVLWFFYEGNDLTKDLRHEKENNMLMNYLGKKFNQNLINKQLILNKIIKDRTLDRITLEENKTKDLFEERKKTFNNFLHNTQYLRLWAVRSLIKKIFSTQDIDPLFYQLLANTKEQVSEWGGQLYFVYLPEKKRYSNKFNFYIAKNSFRNKKKIIKVIKSLDIELIDIDKEIFNNHQDPLALFYGHYNEKGYKLIAEHILSQKLQ